ncbi:MAG: hypothetical protein CL677_04175 [Bdellovibrionaceae bacterium]|nr:hypothetical protein [Pseudobdellovibrionaceae bacterium]|tara:strand:+ start:29775 stop:31274 length:1500 start_codon:yes stop_codon:yes gene_type:complete
MPSKSFFHDPIYGHVFLNGLERALVDTIEFQRLRFIRQNSLLHYVFPGAFHSRFSHSVGVCHNASKILRQLFPQNENHESNYCLQVVRVASLLHDVGHGAFSHLLPHVVIGDQGFLPSLKSVLEHPEKWNLESHDDDPLTAGIKEYFDGEEDHPIEHEALSVLIIKRMFHEVESELNEELMQIPLATWIQDVSAMILYSIPTSSQFDTAGIELINQNLEHIPKIESSQLVEGNIPANLKSILSSLVSGTIDADRMDYMLRDSRECGVNYGLYDYDGLISALKIVVDDNELALGFNSKRVNTLDDFLWSRYQMFKQIYCHKTHSAYNLLLERAMSELAENGELRSPESLDHYLMLTDDYVMSRVFEKAQDGSTQTPWAQAFARRRLPKFIGAFEASMTDTIWSLEPEEIFNKTQPSQQTKTLNFDNVVYTSSKAEVVRTQADSRTLPIAIRFDKFSQTYFKDSYLNQSVFFQSQLEENLRLKELTERLNRKLMFFFRNTL